jgi:hypothetical protein
VNQNAKPVSIIMIEDDEGHARLIEKNIRRAGVNNEIIPFANGTDGLNCGDFLKRLLVRGRRTLGARAVARRDRGAIGLVSQRRTQSSPQG